MSPLNQFHAPSFNAGLGRRDFLKLMGASMALASFAGCRNRMPDELILPYAHQPENTLLGAPRFYTSTFPMPGFTQGILVESHEGRPTKIEGNPQHPASLGAASYFAQASLLDMYSPFRLQKPVRGAAASDWASFKAEWRKVIDAATPSRKFVLLTGTVISPSLRAQLDRLVTSHSGIDWVSYDPISRDAVYAGVEQATGKAGTPTYDFSRAKFVLSLDCDFLLTEPGAVANARAYMEARRALKTQLAVVEPSLSVTGSKADRRLAMSSSKMLTYARALLASVHDSAAASPAREMADKLLAARGKSLVLAGATQPAEIHALAAQINRALGNTIEYRAPQHTSFANQASSLQTLTNEMNAGRVSAIMILGGNPVFTAPSDFHFAEALAKVPSRAHLTLHTNETSAACEWILPESHFLEDWSDVQGDDDTLSLVQPMIAPLFASLSPLEVVSFAAGENQSAYAIVQNFWRGHFKDFDGNWRRSLLTGKIEARLPDTAAPKMLAQSKPAESSTLELELRPDPTVWDGTFSENPWLQELPKPTTQLTWDNAILICPELAKSLSIETGDLLRLTTDAGAIEAAAFLAPGLPAESLTLHLGYGRAKSGPVAEGAGFNAYTLRTSMQPWRTRVMKLEKTGRTYELACTQAHHQFGDRDLIRSVPVEEIDHLKPLLADVDPLEDIGRGGSGAITEPTLIDQREQWAMTIDLDSCIGCSSCVMACQSENNSPVVGKKMVLMGREMHWMRIDRYEAKTAAEREANSALTPQPVTCMHCEKAPCEVVCPVGATNHSSDGINQMVYNRCVGTRYCSNNCPYKVRRFNFFKFADDEHETLKMARNPEVTVRSRGVMEKCTYCVQRIERVRQKSHAEQRAIRDGEIVTACQQSCPTQAITFGNLLDPKSRVNVKRADPRTYGLLTELGTRPRTTYLARIAPEVSK